MLARTPICKKAPECTETAKQKLQEQSLGHPDFAVLQVVGLNSVHNAISIHKHDQDQDQLYGCDNCAHEHIGRQKKALEVGTNETQCTCNDSKYTHCDTQPAHRESAVSARNMSMCA